MKGKLLGKYVLPPKLHENEVYREIDVYEDRLEIKTSYFETSNITFSAPTELHFKFKPKKDVKKFDYRDLILMNETLNKILGPKK